ncbi:response regulator transcription factor [Streptomyces sp. AM 2-1-1]|uniref:response regulator n=1 Tax=Streptomyces sp. AM 2-1-1 TaxID=3028709 RepID=UPI0023B8D7EB|nr:response regulator transcription factor [Streptomyces sp. AM 2-1-1]WEH39077.1 response regulator transcription factor [Streptomyces sp. AM 2-1-1]
MTAGAPGGLPGPSPLSVLLCDDNPMILESLGDVVRAQSDMEIVGTARDGARALELAQRLRPDIVVLDVRFPGGGPSVAREIARCSPDSRIVAFSAYDYKGSAEQMLSVGVLEYVLKGVSNRDFLAALRRAAGPR